MKCPICKKQYNDNDNEDDEMLYSVDLICEQCYIDKDDSNSQYILDNEEEIIKEFMESCDMLGVLGDATDDIYPGISTGITKLYGYIQNRSERKHDRIMESVITLIYGDGEDLGEISSKDLSEVDFRVLSETYFRSKKLDILLNS